MKITRLLVPLMLLCALPALALTDDQVIEYIKTQTAAGKSQNQIGKELLAQGVTPDQVKRIKAQYEQEQKGQTSTSDNQTASRMRKGVNGKDANGNDVNGRKTNGKDTNGRDTNGRDAYGRDAYGRDSYGRDSYGRDTYDYRQTNEYIDETAIFEIDENQQKDPTQNIYGHDLFNSKTLTFEPNSNMATPQNYRLGPGDEVIIDIWGVAEDNIRQEISPDGRIMISQLGPVYLNGMTVAEANQQLKNIFAKKYAGVGTDTDINLTLGQIRSIQIDVLGEVKTPGTFRISPFSTAFHALYNAGGINDIGSLRNIEIYRNGKKVSTIDVYDFLFKGKNVGNVRLQEGDVIIVPAYSELVGVEGNVKRPMRYELKPNESLSKLIEYAGGFSGDAYSDVVRITRLNGLEKEIHTVGKDQFTSYTLNDGDVVSIGEVTEEYTNKVELEGSVYRPGTYALNDNIRTLRQLIEKAEGLTDDAYLGRAIIYREGPDRSMEIVAVNLGDIMSGTTADIELRKNDLVSILNVNALTERGDITIQGYVNTPGKYPFAEGTSLKDLILLAGGLKEGASTARVDISRRIVDQDATDATDQIAEVFTVNIEGGLAASNASEFMLKPYDLVQIRKSPTYQAQDTITLQGQVLFPGNYVLQKRNERISEVIKRAGGLLESAYIKGAYLRRKMTEEQEALQKEVKRLASANNEQKDSIGEENLLLDNIFNVGIDLQKAIDNPGSTYDFVLQEGDLLVIPEQQSTIKITGDVLFPNTVVYVPGKKLKYYVEQAGGYGERARKNKAFVVYMNGSVAKAKGSTPIEPGCQIIIPTKPEGSFDWAKVMTIATTLGSMASLAATIVALTR